jgi:hypothetical protein
LVVKRIFVSGSVFKHKDTKARRRNSGERIVSATVAQFGSETAGVSFVILDHFVSPDELEWSLTRSNDRGQVVQTIEGKLTRTSAR